MKTVLINLTDLFLIAKIVEFISPWLLFVPLRNQPQVEEGFVIAKSTSLLYKCWLVYFTVLLFIRFYVFK